MGNSLMIDGSEPVRREMKGTASRIGDFGNFTGACGGPSGLELLSGPDQAVDAACCDVAVPPVDGYPAPRLTPANPASTLMAAVMDTAGSNGINRVEKASVPVK